MSTTLALIVAVIAAGILYGMVQKVRRASQGLRLRKRLVCPETRSSVGVRLRTISAADASPFRKPRIVIEDCARWPERKGCDQKCIARFSSREQRPGETLSKEGSPCTIR